MHLYIQSHNSEWGQNGEWGWVRARERQTERERERLRMTEKKNEGERGAVATSDEQKS